MQFRVRPLGREQIARAIAALSVNERKMTKAAGGRANERFTERRLGEAIINLQTGAAVLHFPGRRGLECDAEIVQSPRPGQTGAQSSIENSVALT